MTEQELEQKAKENFLRLSTDFRFWAYNCAKIKTKLEGIKPFQLKKSQKRLLALMEEQYRRTGRIRIIVLKGRQIGLSTFCSAYLYFRLSQTKAKKGLVVAHKADSTDALFQMYRRLHKENPLAPSTSYSGRKELIFDELDTGIMVATAGGNEIARGETITYCHMSEVAFWPEAHSRDNFNALDQSIPNAPETCVLVESTPNGTSGVFYELWQDAAETIDDLPNSNGFLRFFSPWFEEKTYRATVVPGFEKTIDEIELCERYGLDDAQICFRREKIRAGGAFGEDKFKQEYPSNADECFLASGRPAFDAERIEEILDSCEPPIQCFDYAGGQFEESPFGDLKVFREIDPGEVYTIGADVAFGSGGDNSVACVLDSQRRQVAVYCAQIHPEAFGFYLDKLGRHFNTARLVIENNGYGLATAMIVRDLQYPNLEEVIREGDFEVRFSREIGFRTTSKTKPLIISRLKTVIEDGSIEVNDRDTALELKAYVFKENGRTEAESGHDDRVMALAIANNSLQHRAPPIETLASDYRPAIG